GDCGGGLRAALAAITGAPERRPAPGVDVLEVGLPPPLYGTAPGPHADDLFALVLDEVAARAPAVGAVYFEADSGPGWRTTVPVALHALRAANRRPSAGFKLRCGGLGAAAFPPPEQVAFAIAACRDVGGPLKFTGGLHPPPRRFAPALNTPRHGFLNVFAAGVFARTRRLGPDALRPILEDEDAAHFAADESGFRWKDLTATAA